MVAAATEAIVCVNKGQTESGLPEGSLGRKETPVLVVPPVLGVHSLPLSPQIVPRFSKRLHSFSSANI